MNEFCAVAMDELNQIEGGTLVGDRLPPYPPPFISPPAIRHPVGGPVGPEPVPIKF